MRSGAMMNSEAGPKTMTSDHRVSEVPPHLAPVHTDLRVSVRPLGHRMDPGLHMDPNRLELHHLEAQDLHVVRKPHTDRDGRLALVAVLRVLTGRGLRTVLDHMVRRMVQDPRIHHAMAK